MNRILTLPKLFLFFGFILLLSGCKTGEDDPFISFRSRDNRLKANWKMTQMENRYEIRSFEPGEFPITTVIDAKFDGLDMQVQTYVNGSLASDSTFGFSYQMKLKDDGQSTYDYTIIYFGLAGLKSGGEDTWYWLNTDKKKARVYLGSALQFPTTAGLPLQAVPLLTFALGSLITDFSVDGLRKDELQLSFDKATQQTTATGGQQQLIINNKMSFKSN
ncbi:MAG TPA: hypothetical protein VK927_04445 [Adhaeribacter sp.]|nr:hypothetical protein [Adhaeribacter sp.]